MTTDLTMLGYSATLCLALLLAGRAAVPATAPGTGRSGTMPAAIGWIGRADRAHAAMLSHLVPFALVVLAVAALGRSNLMSALGAETFFWSWVAHAALKLAGLGRLAIVPWTFSLVGTGLVVSTLFQG